MCGSQRNEAIAEVLLAAGAGTDAGAGGEPLRLAVLYDRSASVWVSRSLTSAACGSNKMYRTLGSLLARSADVTCQASQCALSCSPPCSVLHAAAASNDAVAVRLLVQYGADPFALDGKG
jgi:hypothetical protein